MGVRRHMCARARMCACVCVSCVCAWILCMFGIFGVSNYSSLLQGIEEFHHSGTRLSSIKHPVVKTYPLPWIPMHLYVLGSGSDIKKWRQQHMRSSKSYLAGENSRSSLSWLCLAMTLLKTLFYKQGLSPGWKPKIDDRAMMALVHCFLIEGVSLEKQGFWCCLGGIWRRCWELITVARLSFL
jgi:hypothetical protein